jgi:hypothetical protein
MRMIRLGWSGLRRCLLSSGLWVLHDFAFWIVEAVHLLFGSDLVPGRDAISRSGSISIDDDL